MPLMRRRLALILSAAMLATGPATAEQLHVMSAGGTAAADLALVPQFERATGHTVVTDATSAGIGPASHSEPRAPERARRRGDPGAHAARRIDR